MAGFVKPHKMIAKRNAFSAFPSVWNGVELEDGIESEELKHQFSEVEGDLNLQESIEKRKQLWWNMKMKKLERSSIVCSKSQMFYKKKTMKKRMKKREKTKSYLIFSHVNHTFFILNLWIEPQAFRHTHCTIKKSVFKNVNMGPIQGSIWSLGFWSLDPCLKWPLGYLTKQWQFSH
jgi:hypothetical protein